MFNALTASALGAPPAGPQPTTSQFTQLDPARQPNRKDILQLRRSALALAKELCTDGTPEGFVGLVVQGVPCARITNNAAPCVIPAHPGHDVPVGANQLAAYHNEEHHKRQLKRFEAYKTANQHIKAAILHVTPESFLAPLADPDVGFAEVTVLAIFNHLMETCGAVTREDLDTNEDELKAAWTPTTPIENLWLQATRAQQFPPPTDALSDNCILRALVQNVRNTKSFDTTLKRFDELPIADQTLTRFKTEMNRSSKTWVRANATATASDAGCSSANLARTPATPAPASTSKRSFQVGAHTYTYCWTHGMSQVKTTTQEHNSSTCTNRLDGHQEEATLDNRMGGCNPCLARHRNHRGARNPQETQA